jgi:DHA1 family purine ribonucleoside efflux pump-like MFS transporter
MLKASLKFTLALTALLIAVCAAGLATTGGNAVIAAGLTAIWGFLFGAVPVGWSTWVTRNVPDDAENAGGLQVAVIQLANTVGAALGGYAFDKAGASAPLVTAAVLMATTAAIVLSGVPSERKGAGGIG